MRQVADDLFLLRGFPPNIFNVYLAGGVLIDSGLKSSRRRVLRDLESRNVTAHALTHAHEDHQGSSHAVCEALGVPFWVSEGDEVGGFTVVDTPGHSPGHVSYWREADRTLIVGDTLFGLHPLTAIPGLHEPPGALSTDPAQNRASIRKLAALEPAVAVFGHGRPWRDTRRFVEFAEALPAG